VGDEMVLSKKLMPPFFELAVIEVKPARWIHI
jgi:hypothetical protein